jgi:cellulose synthase/poly-beta-1,6-N-acetylglucosamine synthase-like glycosyltransferase
MTLFFWISGPLLALVWFVPLFQAWRNGLVTDITGPEWSPPPDSRFPFLTIVVPARNEETELEPALDSLLRLDYPAYEVIAVDDRSTDSTGEIMERMANSPEATGKLRVVHVRELPEGWLGKTHAMWLGAQQAGGEWMLFTDADCVFHPESLRRAIYYATTTGADHLVVFPTAFMKTWGERMMISFPQVMAGLVFRPWKVKDKTARDSIGVGAFNLVRRSAYQAMGTFEKLRMEVIDDLKFGEAVKQAGLRQDVVAGPDLVSLRWAVGAMGVVRNLEKNLFAFFQFRLSMVLGACMVLWLLCIWPFAALMAAPGWARAPFAFTILAIGGHYYRTSRITRASSWLFLTAPIAATMFGFAVLRSAFHAIKDGGVTWRGTRYSLRELRNMKA